MLLETTLQYIMVETWFMIMWCEVKQGKSSNVTTEDCSHPQDLVNNFLICLRL